MVRRMQPLSIHRVHADPDADSVTRRFCHPAVINPAAIFPSDIPGNDTFFIAPAGLGLAKRDIFCVVPGRVLAVLDFAGNRSSNRSACKGCCCTVRAMPVTVPAAVATAYLVADNAAKNRAEYGGAGRTVLSYPALNRLLSTHLPFFRHLHYVEYGLCINYFCIVILISGARIAVIMAPRPGRESTNDK